MSELPSERLGADSPSEELMFTSLFFGIIANEVLATPQTSPAWHLVDVLDDDGQPRIQKLMADKRHQYKYAINYTRDTLRGSVILKFTYVGPDRAEFRPPHKYNSFWVTESTWTAPPRTVKANESMSLKISGKAGDRSVGWPQPYVGTLVQLVKKDPKGQWVSQVRTFRTTQRIDMHMVGVGSSFKPFDATVSTVWPKGAKDGEQTAVKVNVSSGEMKVSATYIYRWGSPPAPSPTLPLYPPVGG